MSDVNVKSNPPKRGGLLRKLIWVMGIFFVLLVIGYFVITSGGFVKSVILPKVGAGMNADLTAGDVSLSPFSQLVLRDVKLTPKGADTLLTAGLVRARYSLLSIIRGNIAVDEVTVESPVITVVQNADGSSNLDPLTKGQTPKKEEPQAKPSKPAQIDIKTVTVKNATIRQTKKLKGGGQNTVELSNLNLNLANLKNGGTGKMDIASAVAMDATTPSAAMQGKLAGDFTFDLTPDLKPGKLNGKASFDVTKASGAYAELAALGATVDAEATPTEVKQIALRFNQSGQQLGQVRVAGPFDSAKSEGRLQVEVLSIDRRVLNLAGAASGIDFGTTTITSTNVIELANGGKAISASGNLLAAKMKITKQNQSTPTLDLNANYSLAVDNNSNTLQLQKFDIVGTQDTRPLLKTTLTSPMTLTLGNANAAAGDATLNIDLTGLSLADWRAFAAAASPAGTVNAKLKLTSQKGGKLLLYNLDANIAALSATFGSNSISKADVTLHANGTGTDMKQFKLDEYRGELAQAGQSAATLSGSGTFDTDAKAAELQIVLQATMKTLLAMLPQPDTAISGGTLDFRGRVTSKSDTSSIAGQLTLADLKGHYGKYNFNNFGTAMDLDAGVTGDQLQIRKATGRLREGANPGGEFEATGDVNLAQKSGKISLKLNELNQNGLRPFLESMLGDKKLISVSLNTTANASFESSGDASVKADLKLANLVVGDPKASPLEVKAQLDAGIAKQVAQIRQCQLILTPTERAKNEVKLTGSVDFSKTNAVTGGLKLTADSLDMTRYYDLFGGSTNQVAAKPAAKTSPAPSSGLPEKEPDPLTLPAKNFTVEATIGHFYLREVDATNLQAVVNIDSGHVLIKPAQLAINGAPLSANVDLDLGVAGYRYDVTFTANKVPLAPLVNTFQPERKGQIGGELTANAQIKGAGITGPNIRKNLSGQFDAGSTNLNLAIKNIQNPFLRTMVNVITVLPDLVQDQGGGLSSLAGAALGGGSTKSGGMTNEISKSPINIIDMHGDIGAGKVNLQKAFVESPVFQAEANGVVTLMDVLTNSTLNIPLHIALQRGLAEKINLVPTDTPTNAAFAKLPDYVTVKGTLGKPEPLYNKTALLATVAKSLTGVIPGVNTNITSIIDRALKPKTQTTNASGSVNQQTNAQPDLLRDIGGLFNKPKKTNAPSKPK